MVVVSAVTVCESGWEPACRPWSPSTDLEGGYVQNDLQRGAEPANTKGARSWKLEGFRASGGNISRDLVIEKRF